MSIPSVKLPSNKKFGSFFAALFSLIAAYCVFKGWVITSYLFLSLAMLFLAAITIKPEVLSPLNSLWMQFGFLVGRIINPIILGVIFFSIFTPVAILTKVFGRDELRLLPKERQSYWKQRTNLGEQSQSFKNQF